MTEAAAEAAEAGPRGPGDPDPDLPDQLDLLRLWHLFSGLSGLGGVERQLYFLRRTSGQVGLTLVPSGAEARLAMAVLNSFRRFMRLPADEQNDELARRAQARHGAKFRCICQYTGSMCKICVRFKRTAIYAGGIVRPREIGMSFVRYPGPSRSRRVLDQLRSFKLHRLRNEPRLTQTQVPIQFCERHAVTAILTLATLAQGIDNDSGHSRSSWRGPGPRWWFLNNH